MEIYQKDFLKTTNGKFKPFFLTEHSKFEIKPDVDSYVAVSKSLKNFTVGPTFSLALSKKPPDYVWNKKVKIELLKTITYKTPECREILLGGYEQFLMFVMFVFDEKKESIKYISTNFQEQVLLKALQMLNLNSRTRTRNSIPSKALSNEKIKIFQEDWETFADAVTVRLRQFSDCQVFFYRARHGLSCSPRLGVEEIQKSVKDFSTLVLFQIHVAVEITTENAVLSFNLGEVENQFGKRNVTTYPRFLLSNVGNFSTYSGCSNLPISNVTYFQGYDTKFHMLPKKKQVWNFVDVLFHGFPPSELELPGGVFRLKTQLSANQNKMLQYFQSSATGSGARVECVISRRHPNMIKKKVDVQVVVEEVVHSLSSFMKKSNLLVINKYAHELFDKITNLYSSRFLSLHSSSLNMIYNIDVIGHAFLDGNYRNNDNKRLTTLTWSHGNLTGISYEKKSKISCDQFSKLWNSPYPEFNDHLQMIVESIEELENPIAPCAFLMRLYGKKILSSSQAIRRSNVKAIKPEQIFMYENLNNYKTADVKIKGIVSPKDVTVKLLQPSTNFGALAYFSIPDSQRFQLKSQLEEYITNHVQVLPGEMCYGVHDRQIISWYTVASAEDLRQVSDISVHQGSVSVDLGRWRNLKQFASKKKTGPKTQNLDDELNFHILRDIAKMVPAIQQTTPIAPNSDTSNRLAKDSTNVVLCQVTSKRSSFEEPESSFPRKKKGTERHLIDVDEIIICEDDSATGVPDPSLEPGEEVYSTESNIIEVTAIVHDDAQIETSPCSKDSAANADVAKALVGIDNSLFIETFQVENENESGLDREPKPSEVRVSSVPTMPLPSFDDLLNMKDTKKKFKANQFMFSNVEDMLILRALFDATGKEKLKGRIFYKNLSKRLKPKVNRSYSSLRSRAEKLFKKKFYNQFCWDKEDQPKLDSLVNVFRAGKK